MDELRFALSERWIAAAGGDAAGFARADLELHTAVARAAGNALGASAHAMASVALRAELVGDARRLAADERLAMLHERLIEAIDDGQPSRAARAAAEITEREALPGQLRGPPPRRRG
jgi:DNA-binding FadR family transcriptional regulator